MGGETELKLTIVAKWEQAQSWWYLGYWRKEEGEGRNNNSRKYGRHLAPMGSCILGLFSKDGYHTYLFHDQIR